MKGYKSVAHGLAFYTLSDDGAVYFVPIPYSGALTGGAASFLNSIEDIVYSIYYTGGEVENFESEVQLLNFLNS